MKIYLINFDEIYDQEIGNQEYGGPFQEELFDPDSNPEMLDCLENDDSSENASTKTLASLYTGASGNIAVPQHVHYSQPRKKSPSLSYTYGSTPIEN